jgi:hypothetical protein
MDALQQDAARPVDRLSSRSAPERPPRVGEIHRHELRTQRPSIADGRIAERWAGWKPGYAPGR